MKNILISALFLLLAIPVHGQEAQSPHHLIVENGAENDFRLATDLFAADILVDSEDSKTVLLAVELFSDDVERIAGNKPDVKNHINTISSECVIIGSMEESDMLKKLISKKKIEVSDIKGKWESCLIQTVDNPFPGIDKALVIAGSDRRGTAYGVFELSKQMGVSPWYYFADVSLKKKDKIYIKAGRYIQKSPSVKYRGIFINDEMWGLRPWAMHTLAPEEGKGIGPTTHKKIFELLLRLKANLLWPAMHQQTKPFNYYEENKRVADQYGIVMGSSHIEPMLRNNIAGAEWDSEYPDEPWDYVKNRDHIYKYWEERIKENGKYENMYTIGKRGKDDEAGSEITVNVLEQIFADQRDILRKWVRKDIEEVPQVLIPYTEVLDVYNEGLKVPDDAMICWPDDNFGNIRQLPNKEEQQRPGGSGIYYHFQWLNGATTAYPWLYTTPLGLTWFEMKKAYDHNVRELWIVNVGDIKPAEIGIEYFMQMAWNINEFGENNPRKFLMDWASREFGKEYASRIADIMERHYELAYARRPENMVMFDAQKKELSWEWFSLTNYNDEVQKRIDAYDMLINETDEMYESLPEKSKDSFFQMVAYNVKGAGLHNKKVLFAQKSHFYGQQNRASAARYAALAQQAENEIHQLIHHYNREQVTVGDKWDHMASLPGPWGGQWQQWAMPPLNYSPGNGKQGMKIATEGGDETILPGFSAYNRDRRFIDLYNTGNGVLYWSSEVSNDWIILSEASGVINDEQRIWVTIDWDNAPKGKREEGMITFNWSSSATDEWMNWDHMSEAERKEYQAGTITNKGPGSFFAVNLSVFNPVTPSTGAVVGFVESNGYISIEAEHYSRKVDRPHATWTIMDGLGRTGNSITVLPTNIPSNTSLDDIISKSPLLEYDIYTFTEGEVTIDFNCVPSHPINADYGLRIAVSVDDGRPIIVSQSRGRNVIDNLTTITANLDVGREGQHALKVWMVDPGVVLDKIIVNTGGVRESYLGPSESLCNNAQKYEPSNPNVLLIIADDVSVSDFGCYGNPSIRTPNIDALAIKGMRFTNAYLTTSQCSPTRCSIITGRYPHNTGAPELHTELPEGQIMFPAILKQAGYYTAAAGKWHMGNFAKSAFDKIVTSEPGGEERWVECLRQRPKDKPFFMWLASFDAHRPWQVDTAANPHATEDVVIPPYLIDTPKARKDMARYYDEVQRLDRYVGMVVNELKEQGILENTCVIFMADNGRPFPRCKTRLYDSGIKTPFIMHGPAGLNKQNSVSHSLLSVIDIAPTILELAGLNVPESFQGTSIIPLMEEPKSTIRNYVFAEHNWHGQIAHERMVRYRDFVYIRNAHPQLPQICRLDAQCPQQELREMENQGKLTAAQMDPLLEPRPWKNYLILEKTRIK